MPVPEDGTYYWGHLTMDEIGRAVVEEWTMGADMVVQGLVTEEVRGEIEGRPYQDICLSVDDVLRGSGAPPGGIGGTVDAPAAV